MKISIITVAYNSASTISDTIESVLRQTHPDIEHWIIDGQSTDGTIEIIKSYEAMAHGRLCWISEPDKGIYDAMNKGLQRATGEIIGILNSDDFLTSPTVIAQLNTAFTEDTEAIYGDVHFVHSSNLKKTTRYYSGAIFRPWMIRFGFIPPHPSFYVRRETLQRYGFFDPSYRIAADFEMIARLTFVRQIKTKYLHLDFVTMRTGGASTKDIKARIQGTHEDLRACRQLGIRTNILFIYCKYFFKIYESIFIRA